MIAFCFIATPYLSPFGCISVKKFRFECSRVRKKKRLLEDKNIKLFLISLVIHLNENGSELMEENVGGRLMQME